MEIAKVVGQNIKLARKAKCLTQKEVASKLFMTQQQYSRFETGVFQFNYEQICKLCALFDISPNDIFPYKETTV